MTPSPTGYQPIGLGPGQNEQPRFSESIRYQSVWWKMQKREISKEKTGKRRKDG
jgi:hypothetical protein